MPLPPLINALLRPDAYPHPADRVELVETHISWVLMAGERVYKIKKSVNLGFLDFTTLARRRFFCGEEVRLNRRLAPDVYQGVINLTGSAERPRFGGDGRTVEVAVAMRRLPAERMLDRLVLEGAAAPDLLAEIGRTVAKFHAEADTGGEIDMLGGVETIRGNWEENFVQTADLTPELFPPEWREALQAFVDAFLDGEASRFAARVAGGRTRDCHGDLQAQHICCTDPIQIFDCIEFNRRFRFGDTANEIAFLAMDLERLGRPDLAMPFLNAYLEESWDFGAVSLLDFYRAYRAFVRGKVLGLQIGERPGLVGEARALFSLACRYAESVRTPRLLITTGVMGTGKSTVARIVAARLGAVVIRTDAVRRRLSGLPLRERVEDAFGEGLYAPEMGRRTYEEALRLAWELLAAGWPVIVDGSFSKVAERRAARNLAARMGVRFTTLWCEAPEDVVARRLRERAGDHREVSDGRPDLLGQHRRRYEPPAGEADVVHLDTAVPTDAGLAPLFDRESVGVGAPAARR